MELTIFDDPVREHAGERFESGSRRGSVRDVVQAPLGKGMLTTTIEGLSHVHAWFSACSIVDFGTVVRYDCAKETLPSFPSHRAVGPWTLIHFLR